MDRHVIMVCVAPLRIRLLDNLEKVNTIQQRLIFFFFFYLILYGALVIQSVDTKGLRPLDPLQAGGRYRPTAGDRKFTSPPPAPR